jgi:hypothetical protein
MLDEEDFMEPVAVLTATSPVLRQTFEAIKALQADADKLAPEDARYYTIYLEVARQTIKGLEDEYINILVDAAHCAPQDPSAKERLSTRIDQYIKGEVLRPELINAIEHLRRGRIALQDHAERLLIWPCVRRNRNEALAQFDCLVNELQRYLGHLGERTGDSAVGLKDLRRLQQAIPGPQEDFTELVSDLLMHLNKGELMTNTGESARTIEALRIAFR